MTNQSTEAAMSRVATSFAADFASATESEWRAAAEAALKGRPLDPVIRTRTLDGFSVDGVRARVAPRTIAGRQAGARWTALARIDLGDPEAANEQALEDLNNGASGLSLVFAGGGEGDGVVADTLDRLDRALDGVLLDLAPLHLEVAPFEGRAAAAMVAALVERRGLSASDLFVSFGVDLLRDLARTGALPRGWEEMRQRIAGVTVGLRAAGFKSPVFAIDARLVHNAGASDAQELGGALASATEHVRALIDNGVDLETSADAISFAFAVDAGQFAGIAKLRAARLLWAAWRRDSGLPERPVHIHAETSRRMMTQRDAHTNLVRTTIAAFAAGVGGADSVTVLPFTAALGGSDADARRLARNAQSIILEETNAHRVADPAAGAGAIDALTDQIAAAGWSVFQDVERDGGLFASLTSGAWQQRIAETRAKRRALVATRKAPVVGVSEFPQAGAALHVVARAPSDLRPASGKTLSEVAEDAAAFGALKAACLDGASFADIQAASIRGAGETATPLELDRAAAPFEDLRAANDAASVRPAVFLALLGPIAKHSARAAFVRNLFAAGGLETVDGPVGADAEANASALAASGLKLSTVCGSDDDYADAGAETVAKLAATGAAVWLAGRPKDSAETLSAAGVARFVAAGDDALALLRDATEIASAPNAQTAGAAS